MEVTKSSPLCRGGVRHREVNDIPMSAQPVWRQSKDPTKGFHAPRDTIQNSARTGQQSLRVVFVTHRNRKERERGIVVRTCIEKDEFCKMI